MGIIANRRTLRGMLKKVMVVVLFGCVGMTAGLAFGTWWFSSHQPRTYFSVVFQVQNTCHKHQRLPPGVPGARAVRQPAEHHLAHGGGCFSHVRPPSVHQLPAMITESAAPGRLPLDGYVLLGLLAGLSAALGFLVPPKSPVTAVR